MSRTDKTRPWDVKCLDDPSWLEESHDHGDGVCDLPPRPRNTTSPFGSGVFGACDWVASRAFWAHRANGCGCPKCTDQVRRKAKARRARHAARIEAEGERLAYGGFDDLSDVDLFSGLVDASDGYLDAAAEVFDLPAGSFVVGVDETHRFDIEGEVPATFTTVTVLHSDGAREEHRFEVSVDQFFDDPAGVVADARDAVLVEAGMSR